LSKDVSLVLKEFVEKSGLAVSYIGRSIGVDRSLLSRYIHGHLPVSYEHEKIILDFIECYRKRWVC